MKFPIEGKIKGMFQSTNPYTYLLSLAPLKHGAVRFSDISVVALSGGLVLVTLIMYIYIYFYKVHMQMQTFI